MKYGDPSSTANADIQACSIIDYIGQAIIYCHLSMRSKSCKILIITCMATWIDVCTAHFLATINTYYYCTHTLSKSIPSWLMAVHASVKWQLISLLRHEGCLLSFAENIMRQCHDMASHSFHVHNAASDIWAFSCSFARGNLQHPFRWVSISVT